MQPPESDRNVEQLVAAALLLGDGQALVTRAGRVARTARDRELVAIAAAHLGGEHDLVDALARDHLGEHPDSVLAAWIAGASRRGASATEDIPHEKEQS